MDVEISGKGALVMPRPKTRRTPKPSPEIAAMADRLKDIRKRRGFSQKELGEKLSMPQRTVSGYECGLCRIPSTVLLRLADVLKVPLKEFSPNNGGKIENDEPPLRRRILRRLKLIESLPRRDQQLVLGLIDKTVTANGRRVA